MKYNIIEHANSNGANRRGELRPKMGKDGIPYRPTVVTHQYVRAEPRAIDIKRAERAARKTSIA